MKITLISTLYRGGGAERCARELFERERAAGHETRMLVARRSGPGEPPGVVPVRYPWERFLRPLERLGLPEHLRHVGSIRTLSRLPAGHSDVLHLHNLHGGWLSLPALRRWTDRIPTVWTLHDEWLPTGGLGYDLARVLDDPTLVSWFGTARGLSSREPGAGATRAFVHRWAPRPSAVIVPSRYMEALARDCAVLAGVPVHRIAYGLTMLGRPEIEADRTACRKAFGIAPEGRVVLLVAANVASPFKGMRLGIEALSRLRAGGGTGVTVLVAGGKSDGVDWDGVPHPVFAGYIDDEARLAMAYRAADLTLVPSVADNLPYVALESLACGTPLATFRVGGLTEIVGEGARGLTAPAFDTAAMAGNIATLLGDAERRRALGEAGRRWAVENCSMDAFVAANLDVYREAIARRPADPATSPARGVPSEFANIEARH